MADDPKGRILFLLKYMSENTDENHRLTTNQLLEILAENGHPMERKTLRTDMDTLAENGYDIVRTKGLGNSYFMGTRTFDEPELRLMIDAINASRIISKRRTAQIIHKLLSCLSRNKRNELRRSLRAQGRNKTYNDQLLYISDAIRSAIDAGKKIAFQYTEIAPDGTSQLRHDGEVYVISPYDTVWNSDRYYMVGWSDKHEKVVHFRIDRMMVPELLEEDAHPMPADFDPDRYAGEVFRMMDGPVETVDLCFKPELMTQVADHFGNDIEVTPGAEWHAAQVKVAVSSTFYAWVFQFGGKVRIAGPENVKADYAEMLKSCMEE